MSKYFKRRLKHSYNKLWEMVYGDDDQGKGLLRELNFTTEVATGWKMSYDAVRNELGYYDGVKAERKRIINLLELEVAEWLSHDGECDCKVKGEEGIRLVSKIKGEMIELL